MKRAQQAYLMNRISAISAIAQKALREKHRVFRPPTSVEKCTAIRQSLGSGNYPRLQINKDYTLGTPIGEVFVFEPVETFGMDYAVALEKLKRDEQNTKDQAVLGNPQHALVVLGEFIAKYEVE